jgi:hypothetical protein
LSPFSPPTNDKQLKLIVVGWLRAKFFLDCFADNNSGGGFSGLSVD